MTPDTPSSLQTLIQRRIRRDAVHARLRHPGFKGMVKLGAMENLIACPPICRPSLGLVALRIWRIDRDPTAEPHCRSRATPLAVRAAMLRRL